jgi:hypothetical protein
VAPALNPVERALKRIFSELGDASVPCALIGGLAVSARAEPRTTRDVDVAISADGDAAAEQLVFHLQNLFVRHSRSSSPVASIAAAA